MQANKAAAAAAADDEGRISLTKANMDSDIYGGGSARAGDYHMSIPANENEYDVSFEFEFLLLLLIYRCLFRKRTRKIIQMAR